MAAALLGLSMGGTPARAADGDATVLAVSAGETHTCALMPDRTVRCWGQNTFGDLGNGRTLNSIVPVVVTGLSGVSSVDAGVSTCAVLTDRSIRCWGWNAAGQLGDGTTTNRPTPVRVSGISTAVEVSTTSTHSCAVQLDGTVRCWGANGSGQLGDGTTKQRRTPVTVKGIHTAVHVAAGGSFSCAVLADGTVRCWGIGSQGQLGNGAWSRSLVPVAVRGLATAARVAAGMTHACATLLDGTARCWGRNAHGELGDGTVVNRALPVEVAGLVEAVTVEAHVAESCALLGDGTVSCWGWDAVHPVPVAGLTDAASLSSGFWHRCIVTGPGMPWCWGDNASGQLGDRTVTDRPSPVPVSFAPDAVPPTSVAPVAGFRVGAHVGPSSVTSLVSWRGAHDDPVGTGIDHYRVQGRVGTGSWTTVTVTPARWGGVQLKFGAATAFRVLAYDRAGNASSWAAGPRETAVRREQTSTAIHFHGSWTTRLLAAFSGGSARSATAAGATATFAFTGRTVALVASVGPTRGAARVTVDGVDAGTVDLHASTTDHRRIDWVWEAGSVGAHTVRLVVIGTPGHPRFDVDAFVVLR